MTDEEIRNLLANLRETLEPLWDEWRRERNRPLPAGAAPSHSMCRFSALFLAMALERATGETWLVVGGDPDAAEEDGEEGVARGSGGILGDDGAWHAHYWVVDGCWERIVDLTADQFGFPTCLVTDADDRRYIANYNESAVREHLQWVSDSARQWLARAQEAVLAIRADRAASREPT